VAIYNCHLETGYVFRNSSKTTFSWSTLERLLPWFWYQGILVSAVMIVQISLTVSTMNYGRVNAVIIVPFAQV